MKLFTLETFVILATGTKRFQCDSQLLRRTKGFQNTLILNNVTSKYRRIAAKLEQRQTSLAILSSLLHDTVPSLVDGYITISLLIPDVFKILDIIDKGVLTEAIPRLHVAAYNTFELVKDAYDPENGLHILMEIPLCVSIVLLRVFFSNSDSSINQRYSEGHCLQTEKKHSLVMDKSKFTEVPKSSSPPIAAGRNASDSATSLLKPADVKITYLTGLYFNLPAKVPILCPQEVIPLPQYPQAC